jgi:hypothetical protein
MSAAEALQAAQNAGVEIGIDGDDLSLKAASEPPAAIPDELRRHKTEIIAMLRPGHDRWSAEDWRLYFEERAAVAEFDGGLLRTDAEDQKLECCIVELAESKPGTLSSWSLRVVRPRRKPQCPRSTFRHGAGDAHLVAH